MKDGFRPYTTYKAFGAIVVILSLPFVILTGLRVKGPGGEPPAPLTDSILPALLACIGLYVFIASDRKIKAIAKEHPLKKQFIDIKGILIAGSVFILWLFFIILKARM